MPPDPARRALVLATVGLGAVAGAAGQARAAAPATVHDLHGLARLRLPAGFKPLGLRGAASDLSPAEQLERHADDRAAVFAFTRDPHNDWGGNARDPELLNVVLFNPAQPGPEPARGFSIGRYYSPLGDTIALADPRWQEARDERLQWRWLAMDDHFSADHAPRWAMSLYDPERQLRLDLFVWRKRYAQERALQTLRDAMASLEVTPMRAALFARAPTQAQRMDALREARIASFFAALAPLGLKPPADGGITFAPGAAAWIDTDRKALRALRLLASVPVATGLARDRIGRPLLPLALKPGQYPGPTIGGLPALPLQMLYWNPPAQRWQLSELQRPTADEQHPLLPFEQAVADRLAAQPGGRDAAHLLLQRHFYQPPVLDDARDVDELLKHSAFWQAELLAGRIVTGPVQAGMLR